MKKNIFLIIIGALFLSSGLSAFKVYRSKININNHTDHQLKISFSGLTYNPMRRSTQTLKSEVESIKSGEKGEFRVFLGGSLEISIEAINEDGSPKEFVGAAPEYLIKVGHVTPPIDMEITPIEHYKSTGGKFENIKDPNISYIKVYDLSSNKHLVEIADVITNEVKPEQPRATWQMGMPLIPIEEIAKEKNLSELIQQTNFPEDLMRGETVLKNDLGYPVEITIKKVNRTVAPQYQTTQEEKITIEKDAQVKIGYPSMPGSPNVEGMIINNKTTEETVWLQELKSNETQQVLPHGLEDGSKIAIKSLSPNGRYVQVFSHTGAVDNLFANANSRYYPTAQFTVKLTEDNNIILTASNGKEVYAQNDWTISTNNNEQENSNVWKVEKIDDAFYLKNLGTKGHLNYRGEGDYLRTHGDTQEPASRELESTRFLIEPIEGVEEQPQAKWQMGVMPIKEIAKEKNLSELIQQTNFPEDLMRGEINLNNDLGYPVEVTIKKVNRSVAPQYQTPEAETTTIEKDKQGIIGYPSMSGSPNVEGLMIKNINTEEVVWVQEIE